MYPQIYVFFVAVPTHFSSRLLRTLIVEYFRISKPFTCWCACSRAVIIDLQNKQDPYCVHSSMKMAVELAFASRG